MNPLSVTNTLPLGILHRFRNIDHETSRLNGPTNRQRWTIEPIESRHILDHLTRCTTTNVVLRIFLMETWHSRRIQKTYSASQCKRRLPTESMSSQWLTVHWHSSRYDRRPVSVGVQQRRSLKISRERKNKHENLIERMICYVLIGETLSPSSVGWAAIRMKKLDMQST